MTGERSLRRQAGTPAVRQSVTINTARRWITPVFLPDPEDDVGREESKAGCPWTSRTRLVERFSHMLQARFAVTSRLLADSFPAIILYSAHRQGVQVAGLINRLNVRALCAGSVRTQGGPESPASGVRWKRAYPGWAGISRIGGTLEACVPRVGRNL